jgi:hypothetical protein
MTRLLDQWEEHRGQGQEANSPTLLYREPELAVRVIREEFNAEYRGVVIDDRRLFEDVRDYVAAFNPSSADRIEYYDAARRDSAVRALTRPRAVAQGARPQGVVPSGGSLIIEHTEALTVIDVNTGKNVGTSNLEETVFRNNIEAAEEVAKQLRLRDIGGIVVIDFIDMEIQREPRQGRRRVPLGVGPRQDPHAGVRHLRPRARGDDPQAHRRGPARQLRRPVPELRRPGSSDRSRVDRLSSVAISCRAMYAVIASGGKQTRVAEGSRSTGACSRRGRLGHCRAPRHTSSSTVTTSCHPRRS